MEFVIGFFALLSVTVVGFNEDAKDYCDGKVVDIYYPIDQEAIAYDHECPYTKTPMNCTDCSMVFIKRIDYDRLRNNYIKNNHIEFPFPKRYDTDRVYPPRNDLGITG